MAVRKDTRNNKWMFEGKYKDIFGKYHGYRRTGYDTKKEATKAEVEFLNGNLSATNQMDLDELFHLYLQNAQTLGIKESTIYRKRIHYRNHIREYFGNVKVKNIAVPMVDSWLSELLKKGLKVETVNSYKGILKSILTYGVRIGIVESNVVSKVKNISDNKTIKEDNVNYYELEEFQKFISVVDNIEYKDLFNTLYMSGMRIGELEALTWKDILFDIRKININKTASIGATGAYVVTTPKTSNSIRKIDMSNALYDLLFERFEREKRKDGFTLDYIVFGDRHSFNRDTVRNNLNRYIDIAGTHKITLHGFRHSHASLLICSANINGKYIDDGTIAKRLGHTVRELRRTYAHVFEKQQSQLVDVLNDIF